MSSITFSLDSEQLDEEDLLALVQGLSEVLEESELLASVDQGSALETKSGSKGALIDLFSIVVGGVFSTAVLTELVKLLSSYLQRNPELTFKMADAEGKTVELKAGSQKELEWMIEQYISLQHMPKSRS